MLEELLAIAESEGLSGREAYRKRPIHWFIDLDSEGNLIGFTPTTAQSVSRSGSLSEVSGKRFQTPANYHTQVKDGELNSVCTNQHNWIPDFLTAPASELFFDCSVLKEYRDRKKPKLNPAKQETLSRPDLTITNGQQACRECRVEGNHEVSRLETPIPRWPGINS